MCVGRKILGKRIGSGRFLNGCLRNFAAHVGQDLNLKEVDWNFSHPLVDV